MFGTVTPNPEQSFEVVARRAMQEGLSEDTSTCVLNAGYTGAPALQIIEEHGYIPHVKGRGKEARELKRDP